MLALHWDVGGIKMMQYEAYFSFCSGTRKAFVNTQFAFIFWRANEQTSKKKINKETRLRLGLSYVLVENTWTCRRISIKWKQYYCLLLNFFFFFYTSYAWIKMYPHTYDKWIQFYMEGKTCKIYMNVKKNQHFLKVTLIKFRRLEFDEEKWFIFTFILTLCKSKTF